MISQMEGSWKIFTLLDIPKDQHQIIIEKRTKQMIKEGLVDEVI